MLQTLLLYDSGHGHTEKIATRIASNLEARGAVVDLRRAERHVDISPSDYDQVIVGASIHAGAHQREIVDWARSHAATLNGMPTAFFSVSMTAAKPDPEAQATARRYVDEFVEATGWTPRRTQCLAGALQYREYGFATRLMVRTLMRRDGLPTDTSRDYDFTDWSAVDGFAARCAAPAHAGSPPAYASVG